MLQIQSIKKSFADQTLFANASLVMDKGDKIGLVGRNGHGKSTLFKIITDEEHIDEGQIIAPNQYEIGLLKQHLSFSKPSVLEEASLSLPLDDFGTKEVHLAQGMLAGLGFSDEEQQLPPSQFSGGFQIRINLAKLLLSSPDLLLLDEPTNYLDIVSMRWLERFLRSWNKELILITHDRAFMTRVCTHTMAIHRKSFRKVKGTPAHLYQLIAEEEVIHAKSVVNDQKKRAQTEKFITRFRAQANKANQVQSRVKQLEKRPQIEALANEKSLGFEFHFSESPGKRSLLLEQASFSYGENKILENYNLEVFSQDRIAVVGPNGKGKSTLLKILSKELELQNGTVKHNDRTRIGYFGQTHVSDLHPENTIEEEIMRFLPPEAGRGRARNLAGLMLFEGDAALKKINVLSGGEKSRVLLAQILARPCNCLLLDEPTHHLDMESVDALINAVQVFEGSVIMVTHSETLVSRFADRLVVFDRGEVTTFNGGYDEFLETRGWGEDKPKTEKVTSKKKLDRRERAELVQQKNKKLKPIKQKITKLENELERLESEEENLNSTLIEASTEGNGPMIQETSAKLGINSKNMDQCLIDLEEEMLSLEEGEIEFAILDE